MKDNVLEIRDLKKSFGKTKALDGISLSLKPGDYCGLVGVNGAGKSTMIHCLLHLQKADTGFIKTLDSREIGFMEGESNFPSNLKVKEVLDLSASLYKKDCRQKQQELCGLLSLDPDKKIQDLSLGNRKKVGIVCALQHSPRLLVLDEPTNGLDPLVQNTFFKLLQAEHEKGTTILLSSHNLGDVEQYCHRVVFIKDGKIILETDRDALSSAKVYKVKATGTIPEGLLKKGAEADSYIFAGTPNELVDKLSECSLFDLEISKPDMEERFYKLYGRKS